MLIAFEGPDKTGKSTSADNLSSAGKAVYNVNKEVYGLALQAEQREHGIVQTFDRIDWLTHMVYRLGMPTGEWNDARIRTVFAMPEAHLVFKLHDFRTEHIIEDELYEAGKLVPVNRMYHQVARFLIDANMRQDFTLFKTISIMNVKHVPGVSFEQHLMEFWSPLNSGPASTLVTDEDLLSLLYYEDQHR